MNTNQTHKDANHNMGCQIKCNDTFLNKIRKCSQTNNENLCLFNAGNKFKNCSNKCDKSRTVSNAMIQPNSSSYNDISNYKSCHVKYN